jgi:predicted transcriptional regulator
MREKRYTDYEMELIRKTLTSPKYLYVLLTLKREELSVMDLSMKCEIPLSVCYRIIKDLERIGFVKHTGYYRSKKGRMKAFYALSFSRLEIVVDDNNVAICLD